METEKVLQKKENVFLSENQNNNNTHTERLHYSKADNFDNNQMFTVFYQHRKWCPYPGPSQQVGTETQLTWLNMCVLIYQNLISSNACYQATVFSWTWTCVDQATTWDNLPFKEENVLILSFSTNLCFTGQYFFLLIHRCARQIFFYLSGSVPGQILK